MRLRIRGPNGQSAVTLQDDATIGELRNVISQTTGLIEFDVKIGYPPVALDIVTPPSDSKAADLNVRLHGEQLLISDAAPPPPPQPASGISAASSSTAPPAATMADSKQPQQQLSLSRKEAPADAPEVACPTHGATVVLRIMPDDNSCLFRAFNSAYFGAMDNMHELRSVVAQTIQAQPDQYSAAVLEKSSDDYCRWIQSEEAWGGAIEMNILSQHFDIEICSIDVQSLRIDRFNEGALKRCVLVYSGIHYDVIALSPSDPPFAHAYAPPDFDEKVFDRDDDMVLIKALELCKLLQQQHYYTDTAAFSVRCNVCGTMCVGEEGATSHAKQTGHYDFGEA